MRLGLETHNRPEVIHRLWTKLWTAGASPGGLARPVRIRCNCGSGWRLQFLTLGHWRRSLRRSWCHLRRCNSIAGEAWGASIPAWRSPAIHGSDRGPWACLHCRRRKGRPDLQQTWKFRRLPGSCPSAWRSGSWCSSHKGVYRRFIKEVHSFFVAFAITIHSTCCRCNN